MADSENDNLENNDLDDLDDLDDLENDDDELDEKYDDKFSCYNHDDNTMHTMYLKNTTWDRVKIDKVEDYYGLFVSMLKSEPEDLYTHEHLWILGMDENDYSTCLYIVTVGYPNFFNVESARLFKTALNHNSVKIIIGQSRPEADILDVTPTDLDLTNLIYHKAKILEIELVDHIIISSSSIHSKTPLYCSHLEHGAVYFVQNDITYKSYKDVEPEIIKARNEYGAECEHNKAVEMAKNLLKLNLSIEDIIKVTGFTKEEIEELM